jgi:hypothetical protein
VNDICTTSLLENSERILMTTELEGVIGRQTTAEFISSLTEMESIDKEVPEALSRLYASGISIFIELREI